MSLKFLNRLAGNSNGIFRHWIDSFNPREEREQIDPPPSLGPAWHNFHAPPRQPEPRIAWYPSAGRDFRDLIYLGESWRERHPLPDGLREPFPPQLFLHTDYYPWVYDDDPLFENEVLFADDRTRIALTDIEELPRVNLDLDPELVDFPEGSQLTHRLFFLNVRVTSNVLGEFERRVLYAFEENAAFADFALGQDARFSHVIHVRFGGGGGGGGQCSGIWIRNILQRLKCEVFITDGHEHLQAGDEAALLRFLSLQGDPARLQPFRQIPSASWSGHGDVSFNYLRGQ